MALSGLGWIIVVAVVAAIFLGPKLAPRVARSWAEAFRDIAKVGREIKTGKVED